MSSLQYIHLIKIIALQKMQFGHDKHGQFDPILDEQNLICEGKEETADSYNYANMEAQKVLFKSLPTKEMEELLQLLDNIASASLLLGVQWCEYEAALNERMGTDAISKTD